MDRLESLGNTLSQITMYDIKTMYNQAKNVVLNVSEIEAKVREATNDDPWGASSTLMQDIANRTFNYPDFNEIMPSIYSRYMEKEARQWRQIYKALQLLEYLIKHGSERVVDDARAHISTIKMLRNFHYIDDKGKDEGINVRNRSKEIVELLSDVEKIRAERRKAKANKHKYVGTGNDGLSFSSGGSRYGGFGSDSPGGGSYSGSASFGNDYNGSYNGSSSSGFRDDSRRGYEEYNAGDDETITTTPDRSSSMGSTRVPPTRKPTAPLPATVPVPEVDLLGGLDDDAFASAPAPQTKATSVFATDKALPAVSQPNISIDDDEFADFQAAPSSPAPTVTTSPTVAPMNAKLNLMEMLNSSPTSSAQTARPTSTDFMQTSVQPQPIGMGIGSNFKMGMSGSGHRPSPSLSASVSPPLQPQQPNTNLFGGSTVMNPMTTTSSFSAVPMRPTPPSVSSTTSVSSTAPKPAPSANFDDLWSMSLGGGLVTKPVTPIAVGGGKSMKDLEKEKASAGLWGGATSKPPIGAQSFGSFGPATTPANSASNGGVDDLLL
ncbi:ENTH-domain-containing protein [Guyanagaster necrorhizus]|uniref:ENTH-domain-containing protein n=1 Tax=Guyanagaster necrorhizus TaxID=856835 RepID=A0A9P8ART1_9AGAR|nr:ENTH-domain-containing protein [Guyanagaster necrorhizus MCA 3950]KAG7444172.1 ENTH-domain-containing protein [Guyanagaster necrorhizus MCA 3950]